MFPPTLGGHRSSKEIWLSAAVFPQDIFEGFQARVKTCAASVHLEDAT